MTLKFVIDGKAKNLEDLTREEALKALENCLKVLNADMYTSSSKSCSLMSVIVVSIMVCITLAALVIGVLHNNGKM